MTKSELLRAIYRATHDTDVTYEWVWDADEMTITFTNLSEESTEKVNRAFYKRDKMGFARWNKNRAMPEWLQAVA
jgi:hypothetical protein